MYRKLVFVLTMFAVAFGSLSQVQAALATQRPAAPVASAAHAGTPASIATHSATSAVRPATARRANGAWRAPSNGTKTRIPAPRAANDGDTGLGAHDRRATETASAPKITSARAPMQRACRSPALDSTTFTVGQPGSFTVTTTGTLPEGALSLSTPGVPPLPSGVTFTDNRDGYGDTFGNTGCGYRRHVPVHDHRPRTGRIAVSLPSTSPSRSPGVPDHQLCRHHLYRRPGRDLYRHDDRGRPRAHCPRQAHCRRGLTFTTTGTARRHLREHHLRAPAEHTRSRSPPRTVPFLPPPSPSPSRSTRSVPVHQPCRHRTFTSGRPGRDHRYRLQLESGRPLAHCPRRAHCRRESRSPTTGTARRHLREQRLRPPPAEHTRSRSPPRTSSVTTPRPSPSRSAGSPCTITKAGLAATFTAGQAGTFTVTSTGSPTCGLSATRPLTLPRGSRSRTTGTARRHFREHRPTAPAARTRSRSPPRTVSVLTPPSPSPSRSSRRARDGVPAHRQHPLSATFTVGQAGTPLPSRRRRPGCPLRIVRDRLAAGSHVHGQRGRHGDTCGNTGCGLRRNIPVHDHRHERCQSCRHPGLHPLRSSRRARSPALPAPPLPPARPGPLPSRRPGCPSAHCPRQRTAVGSHVQGQRGRHGDTCGNTGCDAPAAIPVHDHRHERCRFCRHPDLHPHGQPGGARDHQRRPHHLYRRPGRAFTVKSTGYPPPACPSRAHCRRESRSGTTGTARRHLREHRLLVTAACTCSRSPPRTVSVLTPPSPSPSPSSASRPRRVASKPRAGVGRCR